jgi:hypothetical protein
MARALARDPAARFGSAKELADSFLLAAGVAETMGGHDLSSSGTRPAVAAPNSAPAPAVRVDPFAATHELPSSRAVPAVAPATPRRPAPVTMVLLALVVVLSAAVVVLLQRR